MRTLLSASLLGLAVVSSLATSAPPPTQWTVQGQDRMGDALNRETDEAFWGIDVFVNETAMGMPEPDVLSADAALFTGSLRVEVQLATKGNLGVGANETDATVELYTDDGRFLGMETVSLVPFEPIEVVLEDFAALDDCELGVSCERGYELAIRTTDRSRVRAVVEARARLEGPIGPDEPNEADIDVDIFRL